MIRLTLKIFLALLLLVSLANPAVLFLPKDQDLRPHAKVAESLSPNWGIEVHKINNIWLAISNGGTFGIGFANSYIDPETGLPAPSCEYPAGSDITYLYIASFWAGAVVGRDTLVSVGFDGNYFVSEFWPDAGPEGQIKRRSNMRNSVEYSTDAVSEQDFVAAYTDTFTEIGLTGEDPFDNRPHVPLGLKVDQRTYAWSYDYAEDFIIFDFTIRNINIFPIKEVYFGIYVDADVYHEANQGGGAWTDDICGYLESVPSVETPGFFDTVRVAWTADNDGDPNVTANNAFDYRSATSVTGTAVLRSPTPDLKYSFNWWIANSSPSLDWGPRKVGTNERPFRDFKTGMGSPNGDLNKYYVMSSNEFDYDQLESAVSHTADGFLGPPGDAEDFADGFDARYLFSFGPFTLQPGDTLPITLAYVAGTNFHVKGPDFKNYWDPYDPQAYIDRLDFSDLGNNAKWANWIYDNPGVDTDNDGDSGKARWVVDSTTMDSTEFFYAGDGVPDFRGASPPPAPRVKIIPEFGRLRVRWNGQISEQNIDVFSEEKDFEGYHVYLSEGLEATDYILLAGFDLDDYNLYIWNSVTRLWELYDVPLLRDSIDARFGADFDPLIYDDPSRSYEKDGRYYYFSKQDWNVSDLNDPYGIHKLYPNAGRDDPADTTDEGNLRYYEYEYIIDNLAPSKPYYVSVTAFDYGSRKIGLSSLESSPGINYERAYPLPSSDVVEDAGLNVQVFPNPYRIDGGYARAGYENRKRTKSAERSRAVHFYNLPNICTIRIYTLSGDLVDEVKHYYPEGGPTAQEEEWDLISRNTQAVVTGIYLWHVKSDMGEQLGKLVIIK